MARLAVGGAYAKIELLGMDVFCGPNRDGARAWTRARLSDQEGTDGDWRRPRRRQRYDIAHHHAGRCKWLGPVDHSRKSPERTHRRYRLKSAGRWLYAVHYRRHFFDRTIDDEKNALRSGARFH